MKRIFFILLLFMAMPCHAKIMPVLIAGNPNATDTTAPEISSTTVGTDGDTVTIVFTEAVTDGGLDGGEFDIDCDGASGANNVLVYSSGDTTNTWVFTATSTVQSGETCNLDFDGEANEVEDGAGNDLADTTDESVTNNSSQGATCDTDTDSVVDSNDDGTAQASVGGTVWRAMKFTLASSTEITSVELQGYEGGADSDTVTVEIYSDSSGDPGSIADANLTKAITCVNLTPLVSEWQVWEFDTTATLGAGTYWVVQKADQDDIWYWEAVDTNDATYTFKYSTNSGSTWTEYDAQYDFRVTGCQ